MTGIKILQMNQFRLQHQQNLLTGQQLAFRQLMNNSRSECPPLTEELIQSFFATWLGYDQPDVNIPALRKGKLLLESKRVEACSMQKSDEASFFSGIVRAAMKRKVSYNVKIKVTSITGDIVNSDCECPAGKGPHGICKHVAAILLMLHQFWDTGDLLCRKSCTDTLQTFHQPRQLYDGSPVKVSTVRKRGAAATADDDPRPLKYRCWEGYNDFVNNTVTNYCFHSGSDLAYRYLRPKADLKSALQDHDYMKLPFAKHWIDNANSVTAADVTDIEQQTRAQSLSSKWHYERAWRLTASCFGDVLKATSH